MPLTKEILEKYPNDIFIETGSYEGWGIQIALSVGFKHIYSIEILPNRVKELKKQFKKFPVTIMLGDSAIVLPTLIKIVPKATILLDAHESTEPILSANKYPLKQELECLRGTPHTILIDDINLLHLWKINIQEIYNMFPEKEIFLEFNNIMVCR